MSPDGFIFDFLMYQTENLKVDELRGSPLSVGTLEEMIDDNHAIVASAMGPEYYVSVMSFVNRDLLEPGCSVLLHNKVYLLQRHL
jgi:26S proteasome regulatory subunit T2